MLEEAADHHGLVRAWRLLAYAYMNATQWGMAVEAGEQAVHHAEQAGDAGMATRFVGMLAVSVLYGPTPVDEAITYCEGVLSRAAEDRKSVAITEAALAHLEAMRGNFEVARTRYRRSRALLEEFGWLVEAALTSLDSGPIEMLAGDLEAAERELRKDYQKLERMGERNYISTLAGLLADVLYAQGRYGDSAEFAAVCRDLASPDDVGTQFLWRCVQAKLARPGPSTRPNRSLRRGAIETSDWLDWQGDGFMDLAEVRELAGAPPSDALEAVRSRRRVFAAKGNVVSARRADRLADDLRAAGEARRPAQPSTRSERATGLGTDPAASGPRRADGQGRSTTMPSRAAKTRTGAVACSATKASISSSVRHGSWWNSASCRALARCASATAYSTAE